MQIFALQFIFYFKNNIFFGSHEEENFKSNFCNPQKKIPLVNSRGEKLQSQRTLTLSNSFDSWNSFYLVHRRNHLSNWSMSKENQDPGTNENQSSKLKTAQSQEKSSQQNSSPKISNINNASDLFELLERCQSQRLDDQRCVLPSYFSQVSKHNFLSFCKIQSPLFLCVTES